MPRATPKKILKKSADAWPREVLRQSLHLVLGFFLSGLLYFTSLEFFRAALLVLLVAGIVLALIARARVFHPLNELLALVERKNEHIPGQSAFLFLFGAMIPTFLLSNPFHIFLGIFALTWQDGFSTLVGVRFGKTKIFPGKTLEGSLGGFIACVLGLNLLLPLPAAVVLALLATVVETLPLDDSLSIPIAVAIAAASVL